MPKVQSPKLKRRPKKPRTVTEIKVHVQDSYPQIARIYAEHAKSAPNIEYACEISPPHAVQSRCFGGTPKRTRETRVLPRKFYA
jgi:hypothetical protein